MLRAQEHWLDAWVEAGLDVADAVQAAQLVTAFVVGFVIEEQERTSERYSLEQRDEAVPDVAP